jgi:hypothetical protein
MRLSASSAANMVGTPCKAVHFSPWTASKVIRALKASPGNTIVLPWVTQAISPSTRPKQWKSGGGQQTMSFSVRAIRSPMNMPLFIMLLVLGQASDQCRPESSLPMRQLSCFRTSRCAARELQVADIQMTHTTLHILQCVRGNGIFLAD